MSLIGQRKKVPERGYNENRFFDEKMLNLDGIDNSQNDRIRAIIGRKQIGEVEKNRNERTLSDKVIPIEKKNEIQNFVENFFLHRLMYSFSSNGFAFMDILGMHLC